MGTSLRVGFAMGGGVSLGSFSGAALSQALKLLLLRGTDRNGQPYEKVEVDVLSGASAGSMSLAMMLRTLVAPDLSREEAAAARLATEFAEGGEFERLSSGRRRSMVAAQVLQDVQEEAWVREMSMDRLLARPLAANGGPEETRRRLREAAGLLDRGAVEALARKYMGLGATDLTRQSVLGDRVLFAISIANLTPLLADASREYPTDQVGLLGLTDGLTSNVHQELRVFDLHFQEIDGDALEVARAFPRRWCRYHTGPKIRDLNGTGRGIGSLTHGRGWAKITATAIASGAFPLAFEPVPLERRSYEYGETEPAGASRWPSCLKGKDRHVFSYVDGGVFNNEPIREAFRLASFMDAQNPGCQFERVVISVDPHLTLPEPSLHLSHHGHWLLARPHGLLGRLEGLELSRKSSLDRLLPLVRSLGKAMANESRVVEADKVFQTRKRFRIRNEIRKELEQALATDPEPRLLESLAGKLERLLEADRVGVMIPAGAMTLEGELGRVLAEEREILEALGEKSPQELVRFVQDPASASAGERGAWLRALTFAAVDRVMDLEGKMERSQLVAISPAPDPTRPDQLAELPGRRVGGFGGFMSELAGEHEVQVARYCSQVFLEASGRIRPGPLSEPPDFRDREEAYTRDLRRGLAQLEERLFHLGTESHVPVLGHLPLSALRFFFQGKLAGLADPEARKTTCEMRICVPDMSFGVHEEGVFDESLEPQRLKGEHVLITFATYTWTGQGEGTWSGSHLVPQRQVIKLNQGRLGRLTGQTFCSIALPTESMLEEADPMPYPVWVASIEEGDRGTQVDAHRWRPGNPVQGLERTILG